MRRGGHDKVSDDRFPTTDYELLTTDYRLPTTDYRLQTPDNRLPTCPKWTPTSEDEVSPDPDAPAYISPPFASSAPHLPLPSTTTPPPHSPPASSSHPPCSPSPSPSPLPLPPAPSAGRSVRESPLLSLTRGRSAARVHTSGRRSSPAPSPRSASRRSARRRSRCSCAGVVSSRSSALSSSRCVTRSCGRSSCAGPSLTTLEALVCFCFCLFLCLPLPRLSFSAALLFFTDIHSGNMKTTRTRWTTAFGPRIRRRRG